MQSNNSNIVGLRLFLKAEGLPNKAGMLKGISDPYANVKAISYRINDELLLGTTEVLKNNLNPEWTTSFPLEYELETNMTIVVEVFDKVSKGKDVALGLASFDVNELYNTEGKTMAVTMKKGQVIARVETIQGSGSLRLKLVGSKLKNVESGMFGKSDPFFEIKKKSIIGMKVEWNAVYRSNVVKDNLNPNWNEDIISLSALCGGDLDAPLLLTIYDHESDGEHDFMGQIEVTVNRLVNMVGQVGLYVMDMNGKDVGKLVVKTATLSEVGL